MEYPGDTASPTQVAEYFAETAKEYGVAEALPVLTSAVELTDAWTGEGDVKEVSGYLNNIDHYSVGYFQQQYDDNPEGIIFGWGTYDQLIDAEYALHRFLEEAEKYKDWEWNENTTDPDALGRWAQAIQRSGVPDAYRDKGYPMAVDLLENRGIVTEYKKEPLIFTNQWAHLASGAYLQTNPNLDLKSDPDGWVYSPLPVAEPDAPKTIYIFPEANEPPTEGNYAQRHPIRYNWRPNIYEWAAYLVQNYDVSCNSYYDHPEGYGWNVASTDADGTIWYVENTSFDVWGPGGRGDWIDHDVGEEIFELLFKYPKPPNINWIIWQRTIYMASNNWSGEYFGDGSEFMNHEDHIHVTYH